MRLLLGVLLAAALMAQQSEPYEGQREHRAPPAGWFCEPQNYTLTVPPAHACSCERMCDETTGQIREDQQCTVYCHMDHCHCEISNKTACHP